MLLIMYVIIHYFNITSTVLLEIESCLISTISVGIKTQAADKSIQPCRKQYYQLYGFKAFHDLNKEFSLYDSVELVHKTVFLSG